VLASILQLFDFAPRILSRLLKPYMLKFVLVQKLGNARCGVDRGRRVIFRIPPFRSGRVSDRWQDKRYPSFVGRNAHEKVTAILGNFRVKTYIIEDSQSNFLVNRLTRGSAFVWLQRVAKPAIVILISG
jgi:hypothetical protein